MDEKEHLSYNTKATMARKADAEPHGDAIHQRDVRLLVPCYLTYQLVLIIEHL